MGSACLGESEPAPAVSNTPVPVQAQGDMEVDAEGATDTADGDEPMLEAQGGAAERRCPLAPAESLSASSMPAGSSELGGGGTRRGSQFVHKFRRGETKILRGFLRGSLFFRRNYF